MLVLEDNITGLSSTLMLTHLRAGSNPAMLYVGLAEVNTTVLWDALFSFGRFSPISSVPLTIFTSIAGNASV
jgi:hypothetical protein